MRTQDKILSIESDGIFIFGFLQNVLYLQKYRDSVILRDHPFEDGFPFIMCKIKDNLVVNEEAIQYIQNNLTGMYSFLPGEDTAFVSYAHTVR